MKPASSPDKTIMIESRERGPTSGSEGVSIAPVDPGDLDAVARLHMAAFEGFFLQFLGEAFVYELYRGFLTQPGCIFLKAEDHGGIVGFVVGSTQPGTFFGTLLKRRWHRFVWVAFRGFCRRPWLVTRKLAGAVFYRGELPPHASDSTLLSSLAVHPRCARRGIGYLLVDAFCHQAGRSGSRAVYLVTDRDGNDAVNRFYRCTGFELEREFRRQGNRWMNRWARVLPRSSESSGQTLRRTEP